jgi:translocation and assembly module TamA
VNPALLARLAGRLDGQVFSPGAVERTRREFLQLGVFDTVRARTGQRLDEAGRLPVTFATTDRPRNAAGFSLAYETNYGPTGRIYYERRNVFGNAERLRLEAEGSRLGLGTEDSNARIAANFRRPALLDGRTSLVVDAQALRERLKAYDRDAIVLAVTLEHPLADRWILQAGPVLDIGRVGRDGQLDPSQLVGMLVGLRFDTTDSVLDPRSGIRAQANVIPYAGIDGSDGFIRAVGTIRTYFDLFGDGGSVVALRGTLGSISGAEATVPLDKRFYSGGGGSVRGVSYQSIGPRDSQNRPEGGVSLAEASVELRQRIRGSFGMVAFLDAGTVGQNQFPDGAELRMGAGLGIRYATAIGPLRLDLAIPLRQRAGDDSYGLYVGLGQAF